MERSSSVDDQEQLPGFRFHPNDEELLDFYLKGASLHGKKSSFSIIIATVNIYQHDPCELPGLAKTGEREWYFFVPRDKRHSNGGRPSRMTEKGFWKATGSDRQIRHAKEPKRIIGLKKTLVFYEGRAPTGIKTDWVMNEYRLPDNYPPPKEDIVLCKVYRKATSMKVLEQRAHAMEEDSTAMVPRVPSLISVDTNSSSEILQKASDLLSIDISEENETEKEIEVSSKDLQWAQECLTDLHIPKHETKFDWSEVDLSILHSSCMDNWVFL